jgi:hypothetical protein
VSRSRPDVRLWRVTLTDSGHELGRVVAPTYEEALGRAIVLASKTALPPQALHVEMADAN